MAGSHVVFSVEDEAVRQMLARQAELPGSELMARCIQHETDHLNGTVFGDRLSKRARRQLDKQVTELAFRYPDDWPVSPKLKAAVPPGAAVEEPATA